MLTSHEPRYLLETCHWSNCKIWDSDIKLYSPLWHLKAGIYPPHDTPTLSNVSLFALKQIEIYLSNVPPFALKQIEIYL